MQSKYKPIIMAFFTSLLRGINVGGNNIIKMAELKLMYESLGLEQVSPYIQSGNVVFQTAEKNSKKLENTISNAIKDTFGHDVVVLLRTKKEWEAILKNNPFTKKDVDALKNSYVFFFDNQPDNESVKNLMAKVADWPEFFVIAKDHAYLYVENGYGQTKLNSNFVERHLKVNITARNWNTVNVLSDMM
jgi:uncharacterized protein (DUF1697 family)